MARNGSGSYTLPAGNPVVSGTPITASWGNTTLTDIAGELTNSLDRQGRGGALANIPMNSFKFTGLAAGAVAGDSVRYEQSLNQDTSTIASAGTIDIGLTLPTQITVTGTTTITSFGATAVAGTVKMLTFSGALTLTHNASSFILPTGGNIVTAAGDTATFLCLGSGNWRCTMYQRASGLAVGGAQPTVPVQAKSSNYSLVVGDRSSLIVGTSSFTLTFGSGPVTSAGWFCYVENAGTGDITLAVSSGSVDGLSGYLMYPGEQRMFVSDGSVMRSLLIRGGKFEKVATGSGNFTAPPGVARFTVLAIGAGGAGGRGGAGIGGAGGSGGSTMSGSIAITAGTVLAWQVGSGVRSGTKLTSLGTSVSGPFVEAVGGSDGADGSSADTSTVYSARTAFGPIGGGVGGGGATAGAAGRAGGDACFGAGGGGGGRSAAQTWGAGGRTPTSIQGGMGSVSPGASVAGRGGDGATNVSGEGTAGTWPGGGGGGSGGSNNTTEADGADGYLLITW